MKKYNYPVYATQGGGIVRDIDGKMVFIEAPDVGTGLVVGDIMPEEWGIIPANDSALKDSDNFSGECEIEDF